MQLRVEPHQVLRESATTASQGLQLPVVVVQQLLQILLERRRRFNIEQITQTVSGTLSKCSNTRNNFFSATTTSRSFTTVGWLSSFRTAISLKMQIYAGLLFHTMMCIVKVSPDGCGWHPFTFSFQMDPLQCHVLLGHFVYRLKRVNNYISTTFFTHLVHNAIRSLTKFAQFRVILHDTFQGGATTICNDKLLHMTSFCFFDEGTWHPPHLAPSHD